MNTSTTKDGIFIHEEGSDHLSPHGHVDFRRYVTKSPTSFGGLAERLSFTDFRAAWHSYESSNIIGQPIFQKSAFLDIRKAVLSSKAVMDCIAIEGEKTSLRTAFQRAEDITNEMMGKLVEPVVRPMAYIMTKIVHQLYNAIHLLEPEIFALQETARKAHEAGISLIFMPTHKSHIDYIICHLLWFHCNISLPFVAAGINLNIPFVGPIFNNCGAFYIQRPFPNDPLYKVIFSEYLAAILSKGYNLEYFIEGGRSRSGKLLPPKLGMMKAIIDCVTSNKTRDCYLLPISISYEKVIETGTYIQELLGKSKKPESFRGVMQAAELLRFNFGQIDIRIGQSFSLRSLLNEITMRRNLKFESSFSAARVVSYNVLSRMNDISVATPSAIVVTCLLTNIGRGLGRSELIDRVIWFRSQITLRGGHISVFGQGNASSIVDKVTFLLSNCIDRQMQLEEVYTPAKRFELSFYRNQVIHLFVSEATLCCALYGITGELKGSAKRSQVMSETQFLSQLFKWEFVYQPNQKGDFAENFNKTLQFMVSNNILKYDKENDEISISNDDVSNFTFICMFLWPYIEAYWMSFVSLWGLFPGLIASQKDYFERARKFGETLYHKGELTFFEAVSNERIQLAWNRFEELNILRKQDLDNGQSIMNLTEEYRNVQNFAAFAENIGKFRRFGKFRNQKEPNFSKEVRELSDKIVLKKNAKL